VTAVLVLFAVTVVATVVGTVLALEAQAWAPYVSRHLVRLVVARLRAEMPSHLRERWVEEIEADAASFADRPLGGLIFSLRLWRKGGRDLAGELVLREALAAEPHAASARLAESVWVRESPDDLKVVSYTLHRAIDLDSSVLRGAMTWDEMLQRFLDPSKESGPDE
jgi:hypothetical protein